MIVLRAYVFVKDYISCSEKIFPLWCKRTSVPVDLPLPSSNVSSQALAKRLFLDCQTRAC